MENTDHINELIAGFLAGEATGPEMAEVNQWRNASPENEKYFKDLEFIFNETKAMHKTRQVDTEKAWNKVLGKIQHGNSVSIPLSHAKQSYFFYKIAASIILVAGLTFSMYKLINYTNPPSLAIVSGNAEIRQNLPDGSEVVVKAHSSLKAIHLSSKNREYELAGEAYFKVVHNEKSPFIIHSDKALIRDIGTAFKVIATKQNDSIQVDVESGSVQLYSDGKDGIILKAGEKGVYIRKNETFEKMPVEEKGQRAKDLQFENAPLSEVIKKLGSSFNTHIKLENERLGLCRITVKFNGESLDEIIDIIAQTLNLKISKGNNTIVLYGKGC